MAIPFSVNLVNSRTARRDKGRREWMSGGPEAESDASACCSAMWRRDHQPSQSRPCIMLDMQKDTQLTHLASLGDGTDGDIQIGKYMHTYEREPCLRKDEKNICVIVWAVAARAKIGLGAFNDGSSAFLLDFSLIHLMSLLQCIM